jgi:SRSO17 transposase
VHLVGDLVEKAAYRAGLYLYDRRIWRKDAAWENSQWHSSSYRAVDEFEYLCALLAPVERKNGWQLAEVMGDRTPDATQRLLYQAQWEADDVRDELQRFIIEHFGDEEDQGAPRTYDWACQRIVECCDQLPSRDGWLLARRSLSQPDEIDYYLSNAPADTPLLKLAQVAATRYTVEQCLEEAKGEVGLDHYEVRSWQR